MPVVLVPSPRFKNIVATPLQLLISFFQGDDDDDDDVPDLVENFDDVAAADDSDSEGPPELVEN